MARHQTGIALTGNDKDNHTSAVSVCMTYNDHSAQVEVNKQYLRVMDDSTLNKRRR